MVPGLMGLVDGLGGVREEIEQLQGCVFFNFLLARWLVVPVCTTSPRLS